MNTTENIVYELIKIRKKKGLTQKQLAEISGLSQQSVSRLETLTCEPTLSTLIVYANAMEVKIKFK